jgi:translation initiation factor IF-2
MSGMLAPDKARRGHRLGRDPQVFVASKIGTIAGCMVTSGMVTRSAHAACCAKTW